ncbi:MAG: DPP IV N-terminal domain-containing protein [Massilibacteroides sp.]|nr:DPP IV N-terminal domain-containing protein [Massilibacteroides sp.]MDD3061985.1 DPP IV N-terminal domain-containing protein [Massilibacteroides sp.]MDD4114040.1 DPP IV N-terminal domain-containing protein [Massilibacteroides sp.]MDD4659298.1 DPP IV N-terminal domain-containing protein [Massilibacteroides sp.]
MSINYKRPVFFCLFALIYGMGIKAQDKTFTLHDLTPGGKTYHKFTPRALKQLQWCGNRYVYLKGDSLLAAEAGKEEQVILTRVELNRTLQAAGRDSVAAFPSFSVPDKNRPVLAFDSKGYRIEYDLRAAQITATYFLKKEWKNIEPAPANGWLAFTSGNNIELLSVRQERREVTRETVDGIVCGQAVHQREFGITKGLFWSPGGNSLAFYRMDERMVTGYPIVDIDQRCAEVKPLKYPMAGMKSHEVTVGVYHLSSGKTVWLQTGLPKEKYLTNIGWSPDEKHIYLAELNREQKECLLVCYDALTGEREKILFREQNERYVEPQNPVLFLPGRYDRFIWQSRRDGFNHLYLYSTDGKLLKQLTPGAWIVKEVLGFDKKGRSVFVSATEGNGRETHTWKVRLADGKRTCLTTNGGVHASRLSPEGDYLIDMHISPSIPRNMDLLETKGGKLVKRLFAAVDPYKGYKVPEIIVGQIKAEDGTTDLNYRLVKPVGFDVAKKYPVVVYVYGGPHAQLITDRTWYGAGGWDIYMAQNGYVVFTLDSRGSANRGFAFESVIYRNLGVHEMADQLKGVDFLKSQPFVNADRIGVYGWSYGGFMATNLMLSYPDIFKVGVAGGPVIDWSNYEIMYGERYMDRPQDNPEGYANANLKLKAGNLKGRLLLIHGAVDPVVVWQHSLGFLKACIEAGTSPDYFVYPTHPHNVIGKDRPHLFEKIARYFDDFL